MKIIYINGGLMNRGGIESYMMNYYRHFKNIHVDFIVHDAGGHGYYDEEIRTLGGKIFKLPQKSKHPFTYSSKLKKILIENEYDIIHTHIDAMGAWVLKIAKECNIPIRIAHSHNTQHLTNNPIKLFFLEKARKNINKYATHRMACSEDAGKWLFGNEKFIIVKNAIELDKFIYNPNTRNIIRNRYGIRENEFLIGHIGRFDTQKNHPFLIELFSHIKKNVPNVKLMLVGEGKLMTNIINKVENYNLQDSVIFTGSKDNANEFYNAFDLFALPSLFEGLGIVAIEAEVNGCNTILSDKIPSDAKICENAIFLPLDIQTWSQYIINIIEEHNDRHKALFNIYNSGYDIVTESLKLEKIYFDLWENNQKKYYS